MPTTVTVTGGTADVSIDVQRGIPGPNTVTTSTTTNITGIIKGNGSVVSQAISGTDYAAALGANDNYVTDAQLVVIGNTSGTNTGDQFTSVTSHRLIGRHAGSSGAAQEVQVGDGIEFQGSGIRRSALTGDITASAGSNSTTLASTIAGAKTLSGQLELTGQAATTANSAMNRSLVDARSLVSLQGTTQTINNVATYTASNMTLSLGVGTWELNGLFYISAAATGGSKIYISVVSGAQPEAYQNRFTILRVQAGSNTPTLGHDAPAYGGGTFPFRLEKSLTNSADSLYYLNPSLLVLTAATQIDIGFSQNTAAVGNLQLYSFSRFWAKRLTH